MTQFDSLYKQLQDMSAELDKTDAKNKNLQLEVKQNKSFQKLNQSNASLCSTGKGRFRTSIGIGTQDFS